MGAYPAYKRDYDAMVFIDGTDVVAIDSNGSVIAHGTAGTDDATVIQAAINALSSGESLVINQGDYVISSTIIINKKNVNISGLGTESTILTADSDITVVRVLNSSYSCLEKMCLSASSAQTSPVLELNASDGPIHFSRFIRLKILNTHINYNANAIDIVGSGTGSVMCCTFDDIQLYSRWNHGILFNFNDTSWATASVFNNIVIWHPDAGIRFDGGTRHVTGGSVYSNIIIEGHPSHTTSGGFVDIGGEGNTFIGNFCYDWGVGYGPMYSFTSTSRGNTLISPQFNSTSFPSDGIIDEGNYNVILGTPFQNVASRDIRVVGPYQRYTTISEALSSISGNSSSRRFVIYVIGNVTENLTSDIVLKSYVDIIGIGNPKVTLNGDNGYRFLCYDDIDVLIDNLHLIRSGTGDSGTGAIYIYGRGSNGTLTIRNCKIEANCSVYSDGIRITVASGNVLIEGCDISSTGGGTSCGIRITYTKDTSNIRIRNSEIYGAYRGILVDAGCYVNVLDIYGCNITGGNNSCAVGYNVPITITGCKFFPGTSSGSTITVSRGVVKDSTIYVEGNNSTTSKSCAVFSDGNGDAKFINCDIIPMRYNSYTTWDHDGGFSVLPVSGSPYCFVHCIIHVLTAGGTIRVGTAAGLDDIASVSAATTGNKYIIIEKTAFAADTPFYTSSTDPACSYNIYYDYMLDWPRVPVRIDSNSPVLEFIDCYISAPYSSDAVLYNFWSSEGKIINSVIEQPNPDQLAINTHASITCPDIYGTYINGKISSTITSFPPNANNYGIGSITPALLRPDITSFLETVGTPKLLCPCSEVTGTSITDYTRNSNTLTAQASVADWYGFHGRATYYDFDGSAHYLYRANDTDFDFGDAAVDSAFSIVVAINPDDATSRQIIGKWDDNNQREWRLFFDANDYPTFQLYDESADTWIGRQDQTAFTTGSWQVLVATYDGSGINAGCKIYIDGVQLDDTDYDNGAYVAMEAVTANLMVGALKNAAVYSEYYDGKMTWIGVAAKELSADEVWSLTQRLKGVLGI